MRRTSVLPQAKPWRRANSVRLSSSRERGPRGMEYPVGRCGITFEKFQDIKEGDIIEAYLMEQIEV